MYESCINDEIPEFKCVNGPIKSDIALHKKKTIITKTQMKTQTIYRVLQYRKASENNVIRTTETPNNNDVLNDDLAAPTQKKKFPTKATPSKLGLTETEFNKRKNSSPMILELNIPVSNKTVEGFSSKSSDVDFDDKPSKQESHRSWKTKSCLAIEVGQTVKHSDEQVKAGKEIQTAPTENTNNADNSTVQENNEEWRKVPALILGDWTICREKDIQKQENQSQIFPRSKN